VVVKPTLRTKSVGTKVTEEEYARLEALAGSQSLSEWVRDTLLAADRLAAVTPADKAVLGELLALRTILLNMLFKVANGEKIRAASTRKELGVADRELGLSRSWTAAAS
jgi:hypothetical protein